MATDRELAQFEYYFDNDRNDNTVHPSDYVKNTLKNHMKTIETEEVGKLDGQYGQQVSDTWKKFQSVLDDTINKIA